MDFARDPSDAEIQALVQAFLDLYVKYSAKWKVVLGPEERALVRTVNSAHVVKELWRRLLAAADHKVLREKRRELRAIGKHAEADRLTLICDKLPDSWNNDPLPQTRPTKVR